MKESQKKMINLIRAALTDYVPEEDGFDFAKIFQMAGEGGYTSLIYYGALKVPSFAAYPGKKAVIRTVCTEIARSRNQMEEVKKFSEYMDARGVDYCFLKGTELKPMPAANRIMSAANELSFHAGSVDKVVQILEDSDGDRNLLCRTEVPVTLHRKVEFSHITYRYQGGTEDILQDVSMTVPAGHSVGIVGPSGAGKTTAVDILLGLLKPQKGQVLSDGVDVTENFPGWLDLVAYIPQNVFMLNGSILENVAFGQRVCDEEKIWRALEDAQLAGFIKKLPDGLDTQIGEQGIRLSGGQRQRIGIARALYLDPQLLVFDEATSSLDNETESAIIDSINALHGKKTMVIIAHRLQTIENCDMVYKVSDRKMERIR